MPKIIDKSSKIFSKKYISLITLIPLLLGIALSILFKDFNFQELLSSDAVITAPDILGISAPNVMSFQGRLTDRSDTPITAPTSVTFKIYNVPSGGTALWTGTCSLTPDGDGIFDALLGSECGSAIPDTVFGENVDTYLGITVGSDTEMTPRQKIVSSAYALNADTLDGFDSSQTPGVNNVVVLDTSGNLTFGITNPVISSSGDIVLSPTDNLGVGTTNPLFRTHIVESGATGEASSILTGGDTGKALVIQGNGGAFISGRDVTNNVEYLLGTASGSSVFMGSATAHNLSFRTNNLDRIVIQGSNGYFGIGDLSPASLFTVGNGDLFQVNSSGDLIKIKNVTYSWPSSNGSGVLTNNGSGTLTWAVSSSSVAWNAIDNPSANKTFTMGSYITDFTFNSLTNTTGFGLSSSSLTSGNILGISSTSTGMTGSLANITLSGSNASNTGSLLSLNNTGVLNTNTTLLVNHYATGTGNIAFRVNDEANDTTPFVIDGDGKVGVGTVSPTANLSVQGSITGGESAETLGVNNFTFGKGGEAGQVDSSFAREGGSRAGAQVQAVAIQSDGKIVIGGYFTSYAGVTRQRVARLNSDGSLDTTFDSSSGADSYVYAVAIQSDGKIVIGGSFTTYAGTTRQYIARLNSDGSLDTTFDSSSGADSYINAIAVQGDGKIVIGGSFTTYAGTTRQRVARLNNDGSLDTTFNSSSGANSTVRAIAIQSDGKILIGGDFITYAGTTRRYIARLNSNGSLDTTFNSSSGANWTVRAIAIQSDGKIVIGGDFTTYAGSTRQRIARLNSDGSLDTTFNSSSGADSIVRAVVIQSDGKIVIGGYFTTYAGTTRQYIARLNSDGSLDTSFNSSSGANSYVYAVAIQSDWKIVIAGQFYSYAEVKREYIARLNSDGSLDTTFNSSSGADSTVRAVAIQSDEKVVIGGDFITYAGSARQRIARLNRDGSLDTTFNSGNGANGNIHAIAVQGDGKIVIGGEFLTYAGTTRQYVARLNSDGSLDTTFNSSSGASNSVLAVAIQSDGKIIIGGHFTSYAGTTRQYIARLNSDGSLDTTFNSSSVADSGVLAVAIQSDGKIIIGGDFTTYAGVTRQYIARINSDGSLDTTFNSASGANSGVDAVAIQSDGKIIIGGHFTSYAGVTRQYIARINSDGSLDTTFNSASGANNSVLAVAIQSDEKIVVGGYFDSFAGVTRQYIARINSDGSLDTTFGSTSGANSRVSAIAIQSDGKIIIGGDFTTYAGSPRPYLARIFSSNKLINTSSDNMYIGIGSSNMTFDQSGLSMLGLGNVGIGVSSSSYSTSKLSIVSNGTTSYTSALSIFNSVYSKIFDITDEGGVYVGRSIGVGYESNTLLAGTSAAFNGNVGIGTATPSNKFVVNSSAYSTIELQFGGTSVVDIFSNDSSNIFIGLDSGSVISSGIGNIALGDNALSANTTGSSNTAIGYYALDTNVAKQGSTALGYQALMYADSTTSNTFTNNTAIGYQALRGSTTASNNTGTENTVLGSLALFSNTSGYANVANGYQALYSNTSGYMNVASGNGSLYSNTEGAYNVASGYLALFGNTSGVFNIAIGFNSGTNITTGSGNIMIGDYTYAPSPTGSRQLNIGNTITGNMTTGDVQILRHLDINGVSYTWPSSNGSGVLTNNGSGTLTWAAASGGGATAWNDILNPTGSKTFTMGTYTSDFQYNTFTSGSAFKLSSSSTTFTGSLVDITLSGSNAANTGNLLTLNNTGTLNTNTTFLINHYATGTNNLAFRVNDVAGDTSPFVIDGNGNVGIGLANPSVALHVNGNVYVESANGRVWGINNLQSGHTVSFQYGGDANNTINNTYGSNTIFKAYHGTVFANNLGNIARFGISSSSLNSYFAGNLGVGTTGPLSRLSVNAVGSATYAVYIQGSGYISETAWTYGSDRRLKENISSIEYGLNEILQLNPIHFDYIDGVKNNLGFIAQDVQTILPEAVEITDPETGILGLKTNFIIPVLVKAMKEQQGQISSLSSNLSSLSGVKLASDTIDGGNIRFNTELKALEYSNDGIQWYTFANNQSLILLSSRVDDLETRISTLEQISSRTDSNTLNILKVKLNSEGNIELLGGNILMEGDGTLSIRKLKLEENYSIGNSKILANTTSIVIETKAITTDSKVFINPTSDTLNKVLYVTDLKVGESFKVNINGVVPQDITFDWFIIDSKKPIKTIPEIVQPVVEPTPVITEPVIEPVPIVEPAIVLEEIPTEETSTP